MAGPLMGCSARSAAHVRQPGRPGGWRARRRGAQLDRHRPARSARAAPPRWCRRTSRRSRRASTGPRRRAAVPRAARGRPPAAVRARAVAARAPARRGRGLRPRHHRRHPQIEELVRGIDPRNPGAIQEALQRGPVRARGHPAQQAALARLETLLALVEGWVDEVVAPRSATGCPARPRCGRRCAAAGPPAVPRSRRSPRWSGSSCGRAGCATPPRCGAARRARGDEGRDAVWSHPDLLPTAADLDDPAAFVAREQLDFSELDKAGQPGADDGSDDDTDGPTPDPASPQIRIPLRRTLISRSRHGGIWLRRIADFAISARATPSAKSGTGGARGNNMCRVGRAERPCSNREVTVLEPPSHRARTAKSALWGAKSGPSGGRNRGWRAKSGVRRCRPRCRRSPRRRCPPGRARPPRRGPRGNPWPARLGDSGAPTSRRTRRGRVRAGG